MRALTSQLWIRDDRTERRHNLRKLSVLSVCMPMVSILLHQVKYRAYFHPGMLCSRPGAGCRGRDWRYS